MEVGRRGGLAAAAAAVAAVVAAVALVAAVELVAAVAAAAAVAAVAVAVGRRPTGRTELTSTVLSYVPCSPISVCIIAQI